MVLIFAFKNGIKLNNLSFGGVNISQLYLKYDKKLFVQIADLDYSGKRLDCNVTLAKNGENFQINIKNFYYHNLQMNFHGDISLTYDELINLYHKTKNDLVIDKAYVVFDQNLSPVLADKLFLQFKDDINVRFSKPTLDGVPLDNSHIDIVDMANGGVLKVYLDIYNMLDIRVLKVLGNYEVDLPLKQVGGDTHTIVTIDIPFSKDKGTVIIADAKVKNGVVTIGDNHLNVKQTPPNPNSKTKVTVHVELVNNKVIFDDYTFHSDNLYVDYHDKMVEVSSKQNNINQKDTTLATIENLSARLKNKILAYAVDIKDTKANFVTVVGDTNLQNQTTNGELYMNHLRFEDKGKIDNQKVSFSIEHKPLNVLINGDFGIDIGIDIGVEKNKTKRVEFQNFTLGYKNKIATLQSNISQESSLFTLNNVTSLDKNISKGTLFIANFQYEDKMRLENQTVNYTVEHTPLIAKISGDIELLLKDKENKKDKKIQFDNLVARYEKNEAVLDTNIKENQNILTLHNVTSLDKNISKGTLLVNSFQYEDKAKLENQTFNYIVEHTPLIAKITGDIELLLKDKENKKDKKIKFDNLVARYENNEEKAIIDTNIKENQNRVTLHNETFLNKDVSKGTLFITDFQYENMVKLKNQTLNYEVEHKPLKAHILGDVTATIQDKKTVLDSLDVLFSNNTVNLKTNYLEGNTTLYLTNTTNLDSNLSKGTLLVKAFKFDKYLDLKDEFLPYSVDFKNGIKATIPKYLLTFTKDKKNNQELFVGKLNNLLEKVNYIKNKKLKEGSLYLTSKDDFKSADIIINDLGVDINSTLFTQGDTKNQKDKNSTDVNQTSKDLPKIALKMFNTKVTVDKYDINATSIFANTNKQHIDLNYLPQDENSTIKFKKDGDILTLRATDLSERFIENFLKKDIFDKGLFSISVDGNKTNLYGGVYVRDTTVKNVRILNNLISFINTTPAIITPILALPTLFRMGETNFDMTGYPVRDGHVKFDYLYDTKMLTLPSFYTRSKMMDFKGKGYVDIANQKLEVGLDVIFLKDYSKFFNHIPLVGYIITGDDGNFVTNVDINGTFEKQDFTTHAISNAAEGVVNMIKRTISVPFMPFMDKAKENENNTTKEGN
jgi:hypothetical protein